MEKKRFSLRKLWKKAFTDVRHKYRFSVTDENFHEKLSFRLSRLNVWTLIAAGSLLVVAVTMLIIIFTPVRQFIPGYIKKEFVEQSIQDRMRLDSLQQQLEAQTLMLRTLNAALSGRIPADEAPIIHDSLRDYSNIQYRRSLADSLLRLEIENADPYTLESGSSPIGSNDPLRADFSNSFLLYKPVEGNIVQKFDYQGHHWGIDIETETNAVINAVLDGNVVFTSWSPDDGHILILEHEGSLLSIYASSSALFKRSGDFVKAGEAIGMAGNSSELRHFTGLHFELWYNGSPVDPEHYMAF